MVYKLLHVMPDGRSVCICRITGLSNACFLAAKLQQFLHDDDYLVLQLRQPDGSYRGSSAYSRSGSICPSRIRKLPALLPFV